MAGSGGSTGGDPARAQEQLAQDQARLSFLQSGALRDDAALNVQNISRVLQEYDRTSGQAMGMTALQLARSGNMSRTSRSLNLDRSMGVDIKTPQDVLGGILADEEGVLGGLQQQRQDYIDAIAGIDTDAMRTRLNELIAQTPTAPTAPSYSSFEGTDMEAYKRDLAAYNDCKAAEQRRADLASDKNSNKKDNQKDPSEIGTDPKTGLPIDNNPGGAEGTVGITPAQPGGAGLSSPENSGVTGITPADPGPTEEENSQTAGLVQ